MIFLFVKCIFKPKICGVFSRIITDRTNTECKKGKENHPHPSQYSTSKHFRVGVFAILAGTLDLQLASWVASLTYWIEAYETQ